MHEKSLILVLHFSLLVQLGFAPVNINHVEQGGRARRPLLEVSGKMFFFKSAFFSNDVMRMYFHGPFSYYTPDGEEDRKRVFL